MTPGASESTSMSEVYNQYQYNDLREKSGDLYALTKYGIIKEALAGCGPLRILNAGCGSGELSFLLAQDGHRVQGIDPSEEYIALARSHRGSDRVNFEVSSIEAFASNQLFDAVVATDVLEHIQADQAALEKLARLARPGGLVIITVPAMPSLFGYHDQMLGHFRRYTKASLRVLFGDAGLRVKKIRYFGFTLIPVCILYSRLLKKPYPVSPTGSGSAGRFRQTVLRLLLACDRRIPMPFGTSLIGVFRKP